MAPVVRWLVDDRDAVRLQVQNEDGSWACALVVLRPDWNEDMAGADATRTEAVEAEVEGNLRGIWYDAGGNLKLQGLHHCSPTTAAAIDVSGTAYGNAAAKDTQGDAAGEKVKDPLPVSGAEWNIPKDGTVDARTLLRAVPDFDAS